MAAARVVVLYYFTRDACNACRVSCACSPAESGKKIRDSMCVCVCMTFCVSERHTKKKRRKPKSVYLRGWIAAIIA